MLSFFRAKNVDSKIAAIKASPLFAGLNARQLQDVAGLLEEASFPEGTTVIEKDKRNDSFYLIVEGSVEVADAETRQLGRGDFFGAPSMVNRTPALATVTTTSGVKALVASRSQFRDLRAEPKVALRLDDAVLARLHANLA